jgi:hypothetical protein
MRECDEETFRKYADGILSMFFSSLMWYVRRLLCFYYFLDRFLSCNALTRISLLSCRQIVWENRLTDDVGKKCKVTVDGVDCLTEGTLRRASRAPEQTITTHATISTSEQKDNGVRCYVTNDAVQQQ